MVLWHTHTHVRAHTYTHTHTHTHTHTGIGAHIRSCTHIHTGPCAHTRTSALKHKHTHCGGYGLSIVQHCVVNVSSCYQTYCDTVLLTVLRATLYDYTSCAANLDPEAIYHGSGLLVSGGGGRYIDRWLYSRIKADSGCIGNQWQDWWSGVWTDWKNTKEAALLDTSQGSGTNTHPPRYQSGEGQVAHHWEKRLLPWLKKCIHTHTSTYYQIINDYRSLIIY